MVLRVAFQCVEQQQRVQQRCGSMADCAVNSHRGRRTPFNSFRFRTAINFTRSSNPFFAEVNL